MNKKVLTAAQLRAMFKNYTMSLAVVGASLASADCSGDKTKTPPTGTQNGNGNNGSNGTGNSGSNGSVTVDQLNAKANKDYVVYESDKKLLKVDGVKVEIESGFSAADLNAKDWELKDVSGVKTISRVATAGAGSSLAGLLGGSGLSEGQFAAMSASADKVWKYTAAAGNDAAKLEKVTANATDATIKTFAEAFRDALNISNASSVDKNDAKILVAGEEDTASTAPKKPFKHKATFLHAADDGTGADKDKPSRDIELGKELIAAKAEVKALQDGFSVDMASFIALESMVDLAASSATRVLSGRLLKELKTLVSSDKVKLQTALTSLAGKKFVGFCSAAQTYNSSNSAVGDAIAVIAGGKNTGKDAFFVYADITVPSAPVISICMLSVNLTSGGSVSALQKLNQNGTFDAPVAVATS